MGAGWINNKTRSINVDFTAYNGNHDLWISNWFLLEFPPNGLVIPYSDVGLFKDLFRPYEPFGLSQIVDFVRFFLVFYLLTYHVYREISFERSQGGKAWHYLFMPLGLADLAISIGTFYVLIVRWFIYGFFMESAKEVANAQERSFTSFKTAAYLYHQHSVLEAAVGALIIFRLLSYLRINRHIFIIWQTIYEAFVCFIRFLLVLVPILLGFVAVAYNLYSAHRGECSSFSQAVIFVIMDLSGAKVEASDHQHPLSLVYATLFFIVVQLVIVNSWIAVVIQSYQKVRVASGYNPRDYYWKEYDYVNWSLYGPFRHAYLKYIRPSIDKPQDPNADDEV